MTTKYRWTCGRRKGQWMDTKELAQDAAVKQGLGTRDEHTGKFYAGPLVAIEAR